MMNINGVVGWRLTCWIGNFYIANSTNFRSEDFKYSVGRVSFRLFGRSAHTSAINRGFVTSIIESGTRYALNAAFVDNACLRCAPVERLIVAHQFALRLPVTPWLYLAVHDCVVIGHGQLRIKPKPETHKLSANEFTVFHVDVNVRTTNPQKFSTSSRNVHSQFPISFPPFKNDFAALTS